MTNAYQLLQHEVAVLFASVLLIVVVFLIARVARLSQGLSLALALSPIAYVVALERGLLIGAL
ncbi:hypothetical protein PRN20_03500 [Devosia sp. ZB163]|uniref:hypothetical protein n=1 Tax=Devosia sp. ZB163 TaxID=3025938 RepID=UPI0023627861|nr:hypothetical protein [Devosia sp. ZB163]MDC9822787.1 hypothetical protein [Devosia sp. ZB163]